jgi:hypothetical protein
LLATGWLGTTKRGVFCTTLADSHILVHSQLQYIVVYNAGSIYI